MAGSASGIPSDATSVTTTRRFTARSRTTPAPCRSPSTRTTRIPTPNPSSGPSSSSVIDGSTAKRSRTLTDPRTFVHGLAADNAAFWDGRDVRQDRDDSASVRLAQLRARMRQGVYNELRSVELIAAGCRTSERDPSIRPASSTTSTATTVCRAGACSISAKIPTRSVRAGVGGAVRLADACRPPDVGFGDVSVRRRDAAPWASTLTRSRDVDPVTADLRDADPSGYRHAAIGRRALTRLRHRGSSDRQRSACRNNRRIWRVHRAPRPSDAGHRVSVTRVRGLGAILLLGR